MVSESKFKPICEPNPQSQHYRLGLELKRPNPAMAEIIGRLIAEGGRWAKEVSGADYVELQRTINALWIYADMGGSPPTHVCAVVPWLRWTTVSATHRSDATSAACTFRASS